MGKITQYHFNQKKHSRRKFFSTYNAPKNNYDVIINGPDYVLRFGKYKGRELKNVPTDYLKWAVENMTTKIVETFSRELTRRKSSDIISEE